MHESPQVQPIVHQKVKPNSYKKIKKQQRKWVRQQLKATILPLVKKEKRNSQKSEDPFWSNFGIVMAVLLSIVLSLVIFGLSVGISFATSATLAVAFFSVAETLLILLLIKIIKTIRHRNPRNYTDDIEIDERDPDKHLYFQ